MKAIDGAASADKKKTVPGVYFKIVEVLKD
jgi:hypothetical protein